MTATRVGFAGMTHLGLISAAAAAGRGFNTLGYDPEPALVARLTAGTLPLVEPGLSELIAKVGARLRFSSDAADLGACDLVYIAADVATDDQGRSDLAPIRALLNKVAGALSPSACLVVLCQVPPGFTRALALAPERLFYQVETLVFGRAVERALSPERLIIGCADPRRPLPASLRTVLEGFSCPILPMRYESAELAKVSINMCLVATISAANMIAEICERIGADWGEILPALRLDRRIGEHSYLNPGLGLAGGNLERDIATVLRLAESHGTDAGVAAAWVADSRYRKDWALRILHRELLADTDDAVIGVLGLAYKENTDSVKNSAAVALIQSLAGYRMRVYDPVVGSAAARAKIEPAGSAMAAAKGADALVVMTPWPEFRALRPADLAQAMNGAVVIDPYRMFSSDAMAAAGLDHFVLGAPARRRA